MERLKPKGSFGSYLGRPFYCRGLVDNAGFAKWTYEPMPTGWRCLVDLQEGLVWSRHGQPFSMAKQVLSVVKQDGYNFNGSRWLDCELLGRRTKAGAGTVLLLDILGDAPYTERRDWFSVLLECPFDDIPKGRFLRLPALSQEKAAEAIETMKAVNFHRKEVIWEGVICKHPDSVYPIQTRSPDAECRFWAKDRFI